MNSELTNLLPEDRQKTLRHRYFLRLGVVAITFLILLICASAVLLLPTYVFLSSSANAKEIRLTSLESTTASSKDSTLSAELSALSGDSKLLGALSETPSVSAIIRLVLSIPRPGIVLSGFSYAPAEDKKANILTISGISATRDALRNYQLALQGAPFATSADLPVSVYAKDTEIDFTITVTLASSTPTP